MWCGIMVRDLVAALGGMHSTIPYLQFGWCFQKPSSIANLMVSVFLHKQSCSMGWCTGSSVMQHVACMHM